MHVHTCSHADSHRIAQFNKPILLLQGLLLLTSYEQRDTLFHGYKVQAARWMSGGCLQPVKTELHHTVDPTWVYLGYPRTSR